MSRYKIRVQPVRLALAPLAIAGIVLTTAVPIELRPAVWWDGGFDAGDFIQNLLLYLPLGAAFSRRKWRTLVSLAIALSLVAEIVQVWTFERFSSPYDILANALGACGGSWLWRRHRLAKAGTDIVLSGFAVVGCVVIALLMFAIWTFPTQSSRLASWNPSFGIFLGNESTGDRPWEGTISGLKILSGALGTEDIRLLDKRTLDVGDGRLDAVTLYRNSETVTADGGPAVSLPASLSGEWVTRISQANAFSVLARFETVRIDQSGPARIVSFSRDTHERNFDLGQEKDRLTLRVRTPVSGVGGQGFRAETLPVLKPRTETFVAAIYDGAVSRIFVNGTLYGRSNLAAAGCRISIVCDSAVPLVWSLFGATLAIVALAFVPLFKHRTRIVVATLMSGCMLSIAVQIPEAFPAWILNPAWMKWMSLLGVALIGLAAYCAHGELPARESARR